MKTTAWLRTPLQARSRHTLERILDAAESLYRTTPFEEVSLPAIVAAAGTSIGAFYARFPNGGALIQVLHERFYADADVVTEELIQDTVLAVGPWPLVFERLITATIDLFGRHQGFMKAAYYHTRIQPDADCLERVRVRTEATLGRVGANLLERKDEFGHPDPRLGIELALRWMTGAVRESVVFGDATTSGQAPGRELLVQELTTMMAGYLNTPRQT